MFAGRDMNCLESFAPALDRYGTSIDSRPPAGVELLVQCKASPGFRANDELARLWIPADAAHHVMLFAVRDPPVRQPGFRELEDLEEVGRRLEQPEVGIARKSGVQRRAFTGQEITNAQQVKRRLV